MEREGCYARLSLNLQHMQPFSVVSEGASTVQLCYVPCAKLPVAQPLRNIIAYFINEISPATSLRLCLDNTSLV